MAVCCCSLAGTAACRYCSNNPFAERPPVVCTYTTSATSPVLIMGLKTNADRIRSMTDEELAEWVTLMVCKYRSCGNCPMADWCTPGNGIAEWLKSPVEVDNG